MADPVLAALGGELDEQAHLGVLVAQRLLQGGACGRSGRAQVRERRRGVGADAGVLVAESPAVIGKKMVEAMGA